MNISNDNTSISKAITLLLFISGFFYFIFVVIFFNQRGMLPTPFFFDANDTFMDLYNTIYWSWQPEKYTDWGSVYPIFVFMLGQMIGNSSCILNASSAFDVRDCNSYSLFILITAYIIGCIVSGIVIVRDSVKEKSISYQSLNICMWIFIALTSVSGLFALERGNFIIFAFMLLSLVALFKNKWPSAVALGFAVCIKPYLLFLIFIPLAKKNIKYTCITFITIIITIQLSVFIVDDPNWILIINNLIRFGDLSNFSSMEKIWFPTSISSYLKVLIFNQSKLIQYIDFSLITVVIALLYSTIWVLFLFFLFGLYYLINLLKIIDINFGYFFIILGLLILSNSIGGYGILLLFPFLGSIFSDFSYSKKIRFLIISLLFPVEIPFTPSFDCTGLSFLSGLQCQEVLHVSLWSYARPLILIILLIQLVFLLKSKKLSLVKF